MCGFIWNNKNPENKNEIVVLISGIFGHKRETLLARHVLEGNTKGYMIILNKQDLRKHGDHLMQLICI
jgi:hypothetical protein